MPGPERVILPSIDQLQEEILATAGRILEASDDPVVRTRLLRDVCLRPAADPDLAGSRYALSASPQVQVLLEAQQADGGWGRFHSMDSRLRSPVPTTEWAVERGLALGLDASQPPLRKAARYLYDLLAWKLEFPDPPEKNSRWPIGVRLFLAGTLARLQPSSSIIAHERRLWRIITERTFASGQYSLRAEENAHLALTGVEVARSFLVLNGRYQLQLLGSQPDTLSGELQNLLLRWLWTLPHGLGYLSVRLGVPPGTAANTIDRWFASHALLASYFPGWSDLAAPVLGWLWTKRRADGLWDFGPRPGRSPYLPLSVDWRRPGSRSVDWTVRALVLYTHFVQSQLARRGVKPGG